MFIFFSFFWHKWNEVHCRHKYYKPCHVNPANYKWSGRTTRHNKWCSFTKENHSTFVVYLFTEHLNLMITVGIFSKTLRHSPCIHGENAVCNLMNFILFRFSCCTKPLLHTKQAQWNYMWYTALLHSWLWKPWAKTLRWSKTTSDRDFCWNLWGSQFSFQGWHCSHGAPLPCSLVCMGGGLFLHSF